MLDAKIYPACLECRCPKFTITDSIGGTSQYISCEHRFCCKFIEGQENICYMDELETPEATMIANVKKAVNEAFGEEG